LNTKLIAALLCITVLSACSILPGGGADDEKRMVGEEEITVGNVFISKERAHCEDKSGRSLDETTAELQAEGIKVFAASCAVIIGKMPPALCGATTLDINVHEIDQRKYPEAERLGFRPIASLEDGLGFEVVNCD